MQTEWNENKILLRGRVAAPPQFSHSNHGVDYYLFPLTVLRLSGAEDRINIVASAPMLERHPLAPGDRTALMGQVRSYNNKSGVGSRLVITVYVREFLPDSGLEEDENHLTLAGTICKPPSLRPTPLGRVICDMILAVNRRYGRADYLPCIAWGSLAHQCGQMEVGGRLRLEGRLQSRTYTKVLPEGTQERVAYEISVMGLSPAPEPETEPA